MRKPELIMFKTVGVTKEGYKILREQKKEQGKSMMRIIEDLLKENYAKSTSKEKNYENI